MHTFVWLFAFSVITFQPARIIRINLKRNRDNHIHLTN